MEMGGFFFKNLELYPTTPLQLGSGEYSTFTLFCCDRVVGKGV